MTTKEFDYLVFIGRFQPYHRGHHVIATEALKQSEQLIFVLGSHGKPRSFRNPNYTNERREMIMAAFTPEERDRLKFVSQYDHTYNEEKWIASLQAGVRATLGWRPGPFKIGLIGYNKDHSSYYLKKFPLWDSVDVQPQDKLNATDFRNLFYCYGQTENIGTFFVNGPHQDAVMRWSGLAAEEGVRQEAKFIADYQLQWRSSPYPPIFHTVDALVTQSGHVLLVRRGAQPGEGQLALPGGFVNEHETLRDAVLRELREETQLAVPRPVLQGSIDQVRTYDDPYRSSRGRTITQVTHFKLADQEKLPKVKGSDDAAKAFWLPLSEFPKMRGQFYEDHFDMIEHMLGL